MAPHVRPESYGDAEEKLPARYQRNGLTPLDGVRLTDIAGDEEALLAFPYADAALANAPYTCPTSVTRVRGRSTRFRV